MRRDNSDGVHISEDLVRTLLAEQVPALANLALHPVRNEGFSNRTFRLGTHYCVRLPRSNSYAAAISKEARWLPYLQPHVPLDIPEPMHLGSPSTHYPFPWGLYRWLPGDFVVTQRVADQVAFAKSLARFLQALQAAPLPQSQAFNTDTESRGKPLRRFDNAVQNALRRLGDTIDQRRIRKAWAQALASDYSDPQVWVHGDVAQGNLLVSQGKLSAVIDFGSLTLGDPACDLAIAWTFLDEHGRSAFRSELGISDALWARGRGWALWKALILQAGMITSNALEIAAAPRVIALVEDGA